MKDFDLDDLRAIMKSCAGVADGIELGGDILDIPFDELGYDSLALLEISHRIEDQQGMVIPDGSVETMKTAREVIAFVNSFAAEAS